MPESHESVVHALLSSQPFAGPSLHSPPEQTSPAVHSFPSSHGFPFAGKLMHSPLSRSHAVVAHDPPPAPQSPPTCIEQGVHEGEAGPRGREGRSRAGAGAGPSGGGPAGPASPPMDARDGRHWAARVQLGALPSAPGPSRVELGPS